MSPCCDNCMLQLGKFFLFHQFQPQTECKRFCALEVARTDLWPHWSSDSPNIFVASIGVMNKLFHFERWVLDLAERWKTEVLIASDNEVSKSSEYFLMLSHWTSCCLKLIEAWNKPRLKLLQDYP